MFYSFYGQRLQYYTGARIEPRHFKEGTKEKPTDRSKVDKLIPGNNAELRDIRDNLNQLALDAQTLATKAKANKIPVTKEYLKAELDKIHKHKPEVVEAMPIEVITLDFIAHYELVIKERKSGKREIKTGKNAGKRYTHNAIKNYSTTLSAVKRYLASKKLNALPVESVTKEFYDDFKRFCFDIEEKEISTFAGYVKDIKSVMAEIAPDTFKPKEFIKPGYEADTIYLTLDQIEKIAELDLSDYNKFITVKDNRGIDTKVSYSTLDKVRDMSLIGFFSGLRFSDFSNLDLQSIDGNFIKLKQIKTGGRVTIPIMSKLRPVLAKYPDGIESCTNQRFNNYIKIIAKMAGLTEKRTVINNRGNTESKESFQLWEIISSHACRRSYATNMFKKGVQTLLIMNSTGHKSETAFLKYIRATNEDKAILMSEVMEKLGL